MDLLQRGLFWGTLLILLTVIVGEVRLLESADHDSADGCRPDTPSPYWEEALQATRQPVRPGQPGERAFWNVHSERFIYAPAFDFEARSDAAAYRVVARAHADSRRYTTNVDHPWSAFPTLWQQLPCDRITLTVEAIGSGGEIIDTVGTRSLLKSPAFNGPYSDPPYSYRESARRSLQDLLHQDRIQHWLEHGEPGDGYWGWANPANMMGAVAAGLGQYAMHFQDADDAPMAREVARIVADFLLTLRLPESHPLAHWPLTYWDGVPSGRHPTWPDRIKTNFVVDAGMAFLDMYDVTGDTTYYGAALQIAETFKAVQNDAGTWPQTFDRATGEAATDANLLIPTWVILFFDRLHGDYGVTRYEPARDAALHWTLEHPVRSYGWYAQFLDTPPGKRYKNMSRDEANELAIILLTADDPSPEHEDIALELLRYAEDQFVVWDERDPVLRTAWFPEDTRWYGTGPEGSDWFVPSVLEQYKFYTPISGSNAIMVRAYLAAYQRTGRPIYHAQAASLATTILRAQAHHGGGEIPTHLRRGAIDDDFIKSGVHSALTLLEHADALSAEVSTEGH
jgi:maltose/maltodextrin transport system substrate-binding protein